MISNFVLPVLLYPNSLFVLPALIGVLGVTMEHEGAPSFSPFPGVTSSVVQDDSQDPRAADRKRVLILEDGKSLRARTRFREGHWQRRVGRDWVKVQVSVTSHALQSDLLSRARAMGAELKAGDHGARVVLADWMVRKGLAAEALTELNHVLGAQPSHPAALRVLREREFPLGVLVPETKGLDLRKLLIAGAQGTPAVREALVWRLARLREVLDVQSLLEAQLLSPQYRRRAFAALCARRLARGPLKKQLTDRAVLDTMGVVREQAAFALGDFGEAESVAPLVDALDSRFTAVRKNAAESLGNAGYVAAVAPLMAHLAHLKAGGGGKSGVRANLFVGFETAYVGDYDVEIAQGASIADPKVLAQTSGVVLDVRAQAQITRTVTLVAEKRAVMKSLTQLTGRKGLGSDTKWLRWWEENRGRWKPEDKATAMSTDKTATPAR